MAPSFDDQLDVSERGCTYTVSIRLSDLDRLLASFQLDGRSSTLAGLDTLGSGGGGNWLADYAQVRADVERMRAESGEDAVVHLPVFVSE